MSIFALLATPAFALDCTNRHAATCDAVNAMVDAVNAQLGAAVLTESATARLRPSRIYTNLDLVRRTASLQGCRGDFAFDGWTAGEYDASRTASWFDGVYETGAEAGSAQGSVAYYSTQTFEGAYSASGGGGGGLGDWFSGIHRDGKVAGNRGDTGFLAGHWMRLQGDRGVFVTLHGDCDPGADIPDAFESWYPGTFWVGTPPVLTQETLTVRATADDQLEVWIDGVPVITLGTPGATFWGSLSTVTATVTPGAHTVAVRASDVFGSPSMLQLTIRDDQGTMLVGTDGAWTVFPNDLPDGWQAHGFDDSSWGFAGVCGGPSLGPWGDITGGGDHIWFSHCGTAGTRLFRREFTVPSTP